MNLYEIEIEIEKLLCEIVDPETGEINDESKIDLLDKLEGDKKQKMLNIGKYIKSMYYDVEKFKEEKKRIDKKQKSLERKLESLEKYLLEHYDGKISDNQVSINCRPSKSIQVLDENLVPSDFVVEKITRSISKTDLKKAIESGRDLSMCAVILEKQNIQIK